MSDLQQSDMRGIKQVAKSFLYLDPKPTKFSPAIIKHPFTDSGVVMLKGEGSQEYALGNIIESREDLDKWRQQQSKAIQKMTKPEHMFSLLTKSYYMAFLKYAMPYLSQQDFSQCLSTAWIMAEAPNTDPNVNRTLLLSMFNRSDPKHLMSPEELEQFQNLPEVMTVYRGVTSHNAKKVKALSWTLSKDTAQWFANRFGENGMVYKATIPKSRVFALFLGRNEQEIILDPRYLWDVQPVNQPVQAPEMKMEL